MSRKSEWPRVSLVAFDQASKHLLRYWVENAQKDEGLGTFLRRVSSKAWRDSTQEVAPDGYVHGSLGGFRFHFTTAHSAPNLANVFPEED